VSYNTISNCLIFNCLFFVLSKLVHIDIKKSLICLVKTDMIKAKDREIEAKELRGVITKKKRSPPKVKVLRVVLA
jgi:hypothetical protein